MSEKSLTNSLEYFIQLAKGLNDYDSAVDLIKKIIESQSVYSFGEILEIPFIESMKNNSNYSGYYELLRLFAYGTYSDYLCKKNLFPNLNEASKMKLRHLSIISISSKSRTIPYKTLCEQLDINNIRELEDLIIEAFYANVIKGKLDQLNNQLEIEFSIGRDVTDEQIDDILNVLDNWCKNCEIALKTIETQISNANSYKQSEIDKQANIDLEVLNLKKSIKIQSQEVESMNASLKDSSKKSLKIKSGRTGSGANNKSITLHK